MFISNVRSTRDDSLRVLLTADAVGGVWTYVCELCRALPDVNFVVANMGPAPSDAQRMALQQLPNVDLVWRDYKLEWMEDPWADVDDAGKWLRDLAYTWRCEVIHLNAYAHAVVNFAVPVLVAAHSCVQTWWRAVHGEAPPPSWNEYKHRVVAGLVAADVIVVPTNAFRQQLHNVYGVLPRTRVIYNGAEIRPQLANFDKAPLLFAAGRTWDKAKNIALLDQCAGELAWPIYVAGPAAAPGAYQPGSASLRSLGPLSHAEMQLWLARARIFVSPALYEPFGYGVLEAALQGCALVLGDIDTFREVWGDDALYVSPRDSAALKRAIAELIDDPERLVVMARAARMRAEQYSSARMARAYHAAYRELVPARCSKRA